MTWREFSSSVKSVLRDPAWASIRVFVAILTLFSSVFVVWYFRTPAPESSMKANNLRIYLTNSKALTDVPKTVAARTRVLIDDKEEKDVRFFEYIVDYQGDHPLLKADFEAPIRGRVPENRKIIAVQKSEGSDSIWVPQRIDKKGQRKSTEGAQIAFEIQVTDQRSFEIRPTQLRQRARA